MSYPSSFNGKAARVIPRNPMLTVSRWFGRAALLVMAILTSAEVVTRGTVGFSFEVVEEYGGYMLVVLTFFSLPVCQAHRSFHGVEFVQAKFPLRMRLVSLLVFDIAAFLCVALLVWQCGRLVVKSYQSGDVFPSVFLTPLWIPQAPIAAGFALFLVAIAMSIHEDVRLLREFRQDDVRALLDLASRDMRIQRTDMEVGHGA